MYTPRHFADSDSARMAALIEDNGFAVLVSVVSGAASATHLPLLFDPEGRVLLGHVARANDQWRSLADAQDVLVIFQGPHAYVSPSWYTRPGVPTWNYTAVHVHGRATSFDEPARLRALVDALTAKYEAASASPWAGPYNDRMLEQIVGIEIQVTAMQGKFKLSQNRPAADRVAVRAQLMAEGPSEAQRLAGLMADDEQA